MKWSLAATFYTICLYVHTLCVYIKLFSIVVFLIKALSPLLKEFHCADSWWSYFISRNTTEILLQQNFPNILLE